MVRDHCIDLHVVGPDPTALLGALTADPAAPWPDALPGRPNIWIPATSATLRRTAPELVLGEPRSIAQSPVVLAAPQSFSSPFADAGASWRSLPGLVQAATYSATPGGLGLAISTAPGAGPSDLTLQAVTGELAGAPNGPVTEEQLSRASVRDGLTALTASAVPLEDAGDASSGAPVRMVVATEQRVWSAKSQNHDLDLSPLRPRTVTPVADYPAVVTSSSDEIRRLAADQFIAVLRTDEAKRALTGDGFRVEDQLPQEVGFDLPAITDQLVPADGPAAAALTGLVDHRPTPRTTTLLLDASPSMGTDEGGRRRIDLVADAMVTAVGRLTGDSTVAVWRYDGPDQDGRSAFSMVEPTHAGENRDALTDAIRGVQPGQGARSYAAIIDAYRAAVANFVPGQPNSLTVVVDTGDDSPGLSRAAMLSAVAAAMDPARPVTIDVLAIGAQAPTAAMTALADRTGGQVVRVSGGADQLLQARINDLLF